MDEYNKNHQQTDDLFDKSSKCQNPLFSILELFPVPIEVFSPDGASLFVNKAFLDCFHIADAEDIVGKLNILKDPYINQKLGLTDYLRRVFSGEILSIHDIRVPIEEIDSRYISSQTIAEENNIYQDITCFPLSDGNASVTYVIAIFMIKRIYQSRLDVIKAKEYIDACWLDDFDPDKVANASSMSLHHLTRLFKKYIGMTPYRYYQEAKIKKIREVLRDTNLSVKEVFVSCGADYSGSIAEAFKRKFGMTPTQYRKTLTLNSPEAQLNTSDVNKKVLYPEHSQMPSLTFFREMEDKLFQVTGLFPIPIQIFKPNGDIAFINEAVLKMWNVLDTTQILGKYNLIKDPLVNEQFGLRDHIRRAFQGEIVLISDIRVPLENFWEWYKERSAVYDTEAIYTNILNFPVTGEDGSLVYIISVFFTSRIYQGKPEVAIAMEYLENHWREEFDANKLGDITRLSPSHLARLFKRHTGMTLYSYYQEVKINRLKAALRDKNLSISEAFISCGFEYSGNFARFFRERVRQTPSQYRKTIGK